MQTVLLVFRQKFAQIRSIHMEIKAPRWICKVFGCVRVHCLAFSGLSCLIQRLSIHKRLLISISNFLKYLCCYKIPSYTPSRSLPLSPQSDETIHISERFKHQTFVSFLKLNCKKTYYIKKLKQYFISEWILLVFIQKKNGEILRLRKNAKRIGNKMLQLECKQTKMEIS